MGTPLGELHAVLGELRVETGALAELGRECVPRSQNVSISPCGGLVYFTLCVGGGGYSPM